MFAEGNDLKTLKTMFEFPSSGSAVPFPVAEDEDGSKPAAGGMTPFQQQILSAVSSRGTESTESPESAITRKYDKFSDLAAKERDPSKKQKLQEKADELFDQLFT